MEAPPFRVLGIRRIARTGFLTLERTYLLGGGGTWTAREVVRHPGSVVVVPWDGEHVHLIRQHRAPVMRPVLELPAGKLDVAGEGPEDAARRECVEEVGMRPRSLELLHHCLTSPGFTDEESRIYLALDLERVSASPQGVEEVAADLVALSAEEVAARLADGSIEDAKTIIGLTALLGRLGR